MCLKFWYHMYGRTMGTLNIYLMNNVSSSGTKLWTLSGNQGNKWMYAQTPIQSQTSYNVSNIVKICLNKKIYIFVLISPFLCPLNGNGGGGWPQNWIQWHFCPVGFWIKNFNTLAIIVLTIRDRDFIFGIHTHIMTLWHFNLKWALGTLFLVGEFVFHKHILFHLTWG